MSFVSKNELHQFSFEDAQLVEMKKTDNSLDIVVEALIVKPRNSQNTNYTESYAATSTIHFSECKIEGAIEDGYRYFSPDDVLLEEKPDRVLSEDELEQLLRNAEGNFLYDVQEITGESTAENKVCVLGIEANLDTEEEASYQIRLSYSDVTVNWNKYLNRVQR